MATMHGELAARHPALTTFLRERIDGGVAEKEALRVGLSGGTDSSDALRSDWLEPPKKALWLCKCESGKKECCRGCVA